MRDDNFFSEEELAEAAFRLLACSSLDSYVVVAKRAAVQSTLYERLRANPGMIKAILTRARDLCKQLLSKKDRDASEVELAVLLPILSQTADPEADGLLRALLFVDRFNAVWISSLAKRLYAERALNLDLNPKDSLFLRVERLKRNPAAAADCPLRFAAGINIACSPMRASQEDEAWE